MCAVRCYKFVRTRAGKSWMGAQVETLPDSTTSLSPYSRVEIFVGFKEGCCGVGIELPFSTFPSLCASVLGTIDVFRIQTC